VTSADERALLEAVAFGRDPDLKPADRLRALEMLRELGPEPDLEDAFRAELARLDGRELDLQLDAYCGAEIVRSALAGEGRWPTMEAALRRAIEERARHLAERMYVDRGIAEAETAGNPPAH
jgi:hypothetical protein